MMCVASVEFRPTNRQSDSGTTTLLGCWREDRQIDRNAVDGREML